MITRTFDSGMGRSISFHPIHSGIVCLVCVLFFSVPCFSVDVNDLQIIPKIILDTGGYSGDIALHPLDGSLHAVWVHGGDIRYAVRSITGAWVPTQTVPDGGLDVHGEEEGGVARKCLAVAIDDQGGSHLVFADRSGDVYYINGFPGSWSTPVQIVNKGPYTIFLDIEAAGGNLYVVYEDSNPDKVYSVICTHGVWGSPAWLCNGEYPSLNLGDNGMVYFLCRGEPYYQKNARFAHLTPDETGWIFASDVTDAPIRLGQGPGLGVGAGKIYLAWSSYTGAEGSQKSEMYCGFAQEPGDSWTPRFYGNILYYENTGDPHPRVAVYSDSTVLYMNGARNERFQLYNGIYWSSTKEAPWNDGSIYGSRSILQVKCDGKNVWVMASWADGSSGEVSVSGIRNPAAEYENSHYNEAVEDLEIITKKVLDNDGFSGDIALHPQNGSIHAAWVSDGDVLYSVRYVDGSWSDTQTVPDGGHAVYGQEGSSFPRMCLDIDIDDQGVTHLVFAEQSGDVYYLNGTPGDWNVPVQVVQKNPYTIYVDIEVIGEDIYMVYEDADANEIYGVLYRDGSWGSPTSLGGGEYPSLMPGDNGMIYFLCRGNDNNHNVRFAYRVPRFTDWIFVPDVTNAPDALGAGPGLAVHEGKIYLAWNNNTGISGPQKSWMFCGFAEEPGESWIPRLGGDFPIYYEDTADTHPRVAVYSDGSVLYLNGKRLEERFVVWDGTMWSHTRTAPWNNGDLGIPMITCDDQTVWVMISSTATAHGKVSVSGIKNPDADVFDFQNHPPGITSEPDTAATQGILWTYDCDTDDADGDPLTYSLTLYPSGMIVNDQSGLIQWTPDQEDLISNTWNRGAGVHLVGIKVSDGRRGRDVQYFWLKVQEPFATPVADFTADTTSGIPPLTVHFTDLSAGEITSWDWDFGDDSTSTEQNPTHVYALPGQYTVGLTVTGPGGSDTETKMNYITAGYSQPVAHFGAEPVEGPAPLTVQFTDSSSGLVTSWFWNFGDDSTSMEQNPSYVYVSAGLYTVSLAVSGPGGSDTTTIVDYIAVDELAPTADFMADTTEGPAPLTVQFTDLSTGEITSWDWSFGDDSTSSDQNPVHVYSSVGHYTVSLTVNGPEGSDTETKTNFITVGVPPPVAHFWAEPTEGPAPLTVQFTDSSYGLVTSWFWNFGDDSTSMEQNPSHVYASAGLYTVSLAVSGPGGSDTTTMVDYIAVDQLPPVADFTADTTEGTAPLTVHFTDLSTGVILSWLWDFGDGEKSVDQNPIHEYTATSLYTVSLTIVGPGGWDEEIKTDYILVTESTGISGSLTVPEEFCLHQNYPNPFNASTTIRYELSRRANVLITVYDMMGKLISVLEDGVRSAGSYGVVWDGCDDDRKAISSGLYIVELRAGEYVEQRKVLLLK